MNVPVPHHQQGPALSSFAALILSAAKHLSASRNSPFAARRRDEFDRGEEVCEHPLWTCCAQQFLTMSPSPFLVRGVAVRQAPAPCSCLTICPHPAHVLAWPAWVTLRLAGLSVTRYGSQGTEG